MTHIAKKGEQAACACGCGQKFTRKTDWHKFYSPRCRNQAYIARNFVRIDNDK